MCIWRAAPLNWGLSGRSYPPTAGTAADGVAGNWPLRGEVCQAARMAADHQLAVVEHVPDHAGADPVLVVLVHGSLDRAGSFARVTRRLADLHTVAYDRRGYQGSRHVSSPVHTTVDGHVGDLLAVIDDRPAVVVGHSYGGAIALGAALRPGGPDPILAVGAYEPPLPWLGSWANRPRPADEGRPAAAGAPPDGDDPGDVAERFFRRMVGDTAWDRLAPEARAGRRADGVALAAELAAIRTSDAPFDVTSLAVPAVFGRGSASLPHHRDAVAWLVAHVPGSELVEIDGAGHGAHLTHPDAFAEFVRDVVARSGGPPGARREARGG